MQAMQNGHWWVWWRTEANRGQVGQKKWFLVEIRNGHASFVHHPKVKVTVAEIITEDTSIWKVPERDLEKHRQHLENLEPPEFGAHDYVRYLKWDHMG